MAALRRAVVGAVAGLGLGCAVFAAHEMGWIARWERIAYDWVVRAHPRLSDNGQVVLAGITDHCIDEIDPNSWPRGDGGGAEVCRDSVRSRAGAPLRRAGDARTAAAGTGARTGG